LLKTFTGFKKKISVHGREGKQAGPGVECEPVSLVGEELSAHPVSLLHKGDPMTFDTQTRGNRKPTYAAANHYDV
jgi:hypothetical protein